MQDALVTFVAFVIDPLGHNPEKRLSYSIAPEASLAGHALNKSVVIEFLAEVIARKLNPSIRMKNDPDFSSARGRAE